LNVNPTGIVTAKPITVTQTVIDETVKKEAEETTKASEEKVVAETPAPEVKPNG
jgi:hypothetical protein